MQLQINMSQLSRTLSLFNLQQITFIQAEKGILIGQHAVKEITKLKINSKEKKNMNEFASVLKNHQIASFG